MLMVVFGAGASYDSSAITPLSMGDNEFRPPLAAQLFEARRTFLDAMSHFPEIDSIYPSLLNLDNGLSLEQVLRKYQDEATRNVERYKQLAAVRYYLHMMLSACEQRWSEEYVKGKSNYTALLDEIRNWRRTTNPVCLVNFNYDRLLEKALLQFNVNITSMSDYISNSQYKLIKLHGSVNWGREVESPIANINQMANMAVVRHLVTYANHIQVSQRYRIDSNRPMEKYGDIALFPAIAIPVEAKSEFECPPEHLNTLCSMLQQVEAIITVGWRATEKHFLDLLAKYLPKKVRVLVVTGSEGDSQETIDNIAVAVGMVDYSRYSHGFSRFVAHRAAAEFLEACQTL